MVVMRDFYEVITFPAFMEEQHHNFSMGKVLQDGNRGNNENSARDAIRTHEPLQEWILSPSELAGLSYPRAV